MAISVLNLHTIAHKLLSCLVWLWCVCAPLVNRVADIFCAQFTTDFWLPPRHTKLKTKNGDCLACLIALPHRMTVLWNDCIYLLAEAGQVGYWLICVAIVSDSSQKCAKFTAIPQRGEHKNAFRKWFPQFVIWINICLIYYFFLSFSPFQQISSHQN